ncbi:MAG: hypothetical protein IKH93_04235 [Bacteroidales bacterium]|nr:hypothetical protein [Bacteroidales bacterium]
MELKPKKDWTDAIREKYLSELPESTSAVGWEAIGRRLHRRTVLRRSAVAAAILLPFTALLIWSPWHNAVPALESPVAIVEEAPAVPDVDEEAAIAPDSTAIRNAVQQAEKPVFIAQPEQSQVADDLSREQQLPTTPSADTETAGPDSSATNTQGPSEQPSPRQIRELVPDDLMAFAEPEPRQRLKVSVGLSAGTVAGQRDMRLNTMSAPYFAKLAYMNYGPSIQTAGKISLSNIDRQYYSYLQTKSASNVFMPNPSTPSDVQYRHDLPLTFGLLAKVGLLPWLGVESGVEYTYLHSVADSYTGILDQRLHFIGVPVRLDARIWSNSSFELYAALGGKAEKCVSAILGQIQCDERRIQLAAEVAGGIQYRLWKSTYLYLQPELSWYLTKTDLITYRSENPLAFSFDAGLRFEL